MDIRDVLVDGISQLFEWLEDNTRELTADQVNWLPAGKSVSIGFNAWHVYRTADNITNFVFQRKQPIWVDKGYVERMGLPKVDQGTGMGLEDARAVVIKEPGLLREYGAAVAQDTLAFVKQVPLDTLMEVQMIRPLGEMPKWRVLRQVIMTHGFMHLGEINGAKGQLGLQFGI
jgi:hypothetical protein